jgi:hypothetical protein
MECVAEAPEPADTASVSPSSSSGGGNHGAPADAKKLEPADKAKRTKHSRVQKREKELYGLVTPVFLPLLDARDSPPQQQPEKKMKAPVREHATPATEDADAMAPAADAPPKRPKRLTTKKSALRTTTASTAKPRRKRVSLVIDGQTVLPADSVLEPALTSPSSEATSATNSTTSLDDLIDPRLAKPHIHVHVDAMHHSLPQTVSSPPPLPPKPVAPPIVAFEAPPPVEDDEQTFHTYVGGLRGSGADDVDQVGSYGYPSSLGASYLESYMLGRPLRVRREAADKAGLDEKETREMVERPDREESVHVDADVEMELEAPKEDKDEEADFMGEMEDF